MGLDDPVDCFRDCQNNWQRGSQAGANPPVCLKAYLARLTISQKTHDWALNALPNRSQDDHELALQTKESLEHAKTTVDRSLQNLAHLRIRDLISDEEFSSERRRLDQERLKLQQAIDKQSTSNGWLEPSRLFFSFKEQGMISNFSLAANSFINDFLKHPLPIYY
jgi:hypothetical protein